jgi:hypothetical protein
MANLLRVQRCGRRAWIDLRPPERLRRVDVAQAGDDPLVEQRDLYGNPPPTERRAQRRRGEYGIEWFGTKIECERRVGSVDVERGQRARILQHDALTTGEMKDGAGESRQRLRRSADDPIPVHPEVNMYHASVVEMHQLMFATALDGANARPGKCSKRSAAKTTLERSMQDIDALERLAFDRVAQETNGSFDFGEFGHLVFGDERCC